MSKVRKGMIEVEGTVETLLGGGFLEVETDTGHKIRTKLSGRLRQFRIRVLPGDRVRVEVSTADHTKGFIVYRLPPAPKPATTSAPKK